MGHEAELVRRLPLSLRVHRRRRGRPSDRHRNRIRARLGLGAKVNDEWDLGFRLATGHGEVSGDPVSTNQTLDEAFSKKPIWLDQAFFGYHPQWFKGFNVHRRQDARTRSTSPARTS